MQLQVEVVHEGNARFPRTERRLALEHLGPRGESRSRLCGRGGPNPRAMWDLRTEGGEARACLSRNKETEGDKGLEGMRSEEEERRRNKGKTSESASYQNRHLLFPRKASAASPKTNYSGGVGRHGAQ